MSKKRPVLDRQNTIIILCPKTLCPWPTKHNKYTQRNVLHCSRRQQTHEKYAQIYWFEIGRATLTHNFSSMHQPAHALSRSVRLRIPISKNKTGFPYSHLNEDEIFVGCILVYNFLQLEIVFSKIIVYIQWKKCLLLFYFIYFDQQNPKSVFVGWYQKTLIIRKQRIL